MVTKRTKRDSSQVDKLVAEVDRLHANGMSVNKACAKVGIQNTVYYFRKRKDTAEAKLQSGTSSDTMSFSTGLHEHKDLATLTQEYRELENRLNAIKMQIAEKVMSKEKTRTT